MHVYYKNTHLKQYHNSLGLKTALFYSRTYQRVIRPGLSLLEARSANSKLTRAFQQSQAELSHYVAQQKAA